MTCERGVKGDAPANHAGETGSIPVSRSNEYQDFSQLEIRLIDFDIAKDVIINNHYSHKWNTAFGVENYGIICDNQLLGVAVYGNPMNPASWPSISDVEPAACLELNRLWVDDALIKNTETWFLKRSMALLKEKGYRLIQSFADGRLGVGTIYQAANFTYHGFHTSLFHVDEETGETFHDVPFANTKRPATMVNRNILHAYGRLTTHEVKTYRYLFGLDRKARKSIKLTTQPYPKERDGLRELVDYEPPMNQIIRAGAIAKQTHRSKDFEALREYALRRNPKTDLMIAEQMENKLIVNMHADMPLFEL